MMKYYLHHNQTTKGLKISNMFALIYKLDVLNHTNITPLLFLHFELKDINKYIQVMCLNLLDVISLTIDFRFRYKYIHLLFINK